MSIFAGVKATGNIEIRGARVNNLKNIDVNIPRGKLVVITGVSGSGKSSLAFDTLFAEGQRRFAQSLSSYARQFLGRMSKPDVDSIEGIPPAIAIEQKVSVKNPRSTVATTSEIYDYLRLIYARIGRTYSPVSGREVHADSVRDVMSYIDTLDFKGAPAYILADLKWADRTDRTELLLGLKEQGFGRLYTNEPVRIEEVLQMETMPDAAMLLVDRFSDVSDRDRLLSSVNDAFDAGDGRMTVLSADAVRDFCSRFELDGMRFNEPDELLFSFNSPIGSCPVCGGLGKIIGVSEDLVVPDKSKSLYDGAIACWRGEKMGWFKDHLCQVAGRYGIDIFAPYCQLPEEHRRLVWEGDRPGSNDDENRIIGVDEFFQWIETQRYKVQYKYMLSRFSGRAVCTSCHGTRLRKEALYVKVAGIDIGQALAMSCRDALKFWREASFTQNEREVIKDPLNEVVTRLEYICEVGLGYLTLSRNCNTLSGGESQRLNLVASLGSSLVGSLYVLDEPSVGLHSKDTAKLISVLKKLRDLGNTVVVVEHDEDIIRSADVLIDMGPGAGVNGGEIIFNGNAAGKLTDEQLSKSLTLQYISGARERLKRERRNWNYSITVEGAMQNNLKNINVTFPLGVLVVVSGVSGSGKSSLVGDILYPALYRHLNDVGEMPGTFRKLSGNLDRITRVEYVDQNPIGKSSRSNPATYLKVYDLIRKLLSDQPYAKSGGYGMSAFSFNQDGGRCPECQGEGVVRVEMQFMSDVVMVCEACGGKRFIPEILDVRYRGKNVDDILNMSVREAMEFFGAAPEPEAAQIVEKLRPLADVGLDYLKLSQSSSTLSGGESQRIKLAYFLSMSGNGGRERIMFIFDEPTTGLHFNDVEKLLKCFDVLLDAGHSIVVVEHNTDVIRNADYLIELGPGAGDDGGMLVSAK